MARVRTPADLILLATSVLAGPVAVTAVIVLALASSNACSAEQTEPAIDGGIAKCSAGPHVFCAAVADTAPGCSTDDGSSPLLSQVPKNRYAEGCVINFVGERDQQGDCVTEAVCKCLNGELPSDAAVSTPPVSSDAAVAPAPTGLLWNCTPP